MAPSSPEATIPLTRSRPTRMRRATSGMVRPAAGDERASGGMDDLRDNRQVTRRPKGLFHGRQVIARENAVAPGPRRLSQELPRNRPAHLPRLDVGSWVPLVQFPDKITDGEDG